MRADQWREGEEEMYLPVKQEGFNPAHDYTTHTHKYNQRPRSICKREDECQNGKENVFWCQISIHISYNDTPTAPHV